MTQRSPRATLVIIIYYCGQIHDKAQDIVMLKEIITYLVLADIHLGNSNTTTKTITTNLRKYFAKYGILLKKVDYIFIAGDLYDKLLLTHTEDYMLAEAWIIDLVLYCRKHNIKLRILEGTPGHDWKQTNALTNTIARLAPDVNFKKINTLCIDYEDDDDIHILYVPDEYKDKASDTFKEVKTLLSDKGIEKVDIAIMHGHFHYQLPMIKLPSSHSEAGYLSITKYFITIGHVHIASVYRRILVPSSFDRLKHGEEGPKGGLHHTIYKTGRMEFKFLENVNSSVYKTYVTDVSTLEEFLDTYDGVIAGHKPGDRLRFIVSQTSGLSRLQGLISDKFPNRKLTVELRDPKKKAAREEVLLPKTVEPFSIDKSNIRELLFTELDNRLVSKRVSALYKKELSAILLECR